MGTEPKLYYDTCCFLDMLQHQLQVSAKPDREPHVHFCKSFLEAARNKEVTVYSSTLTVAECRHLRDESDPNNHKKIVTDEVKRLIEGMLISARSGVMPVQPTPAIIKRARDLEWVDGCKFDPLDSLHIATALAMRCDYFVTTDGKLDADSVATVNAMGLSFGRADSLAHLLPNKYRQMHIQPGSDSAARSP